MSEYFAGLDLGQAADHSALAIAARVIPPGEKHARYLFRHVQRLPLATPYPQVVSYVRGVISRPPLKGQTTLAIDYCGVGKPLYDLFHQASLSCPLYGIFVHGGVNVTRDGHMVGVPKRDLIAAAQVLLQSGRLEIAENMPDTVTLTNELRNYRVKIDPVTAHDSYAAWREGDHDDLVFAVALACWQGENQRRAYAF